MTRNIKISERQYRMLESLNGEEYSYLDNEDNIKPYTGYSEISPEGKNMDGITPPEKRVKTDDVGKMETPQSWVAHNFHNRAFATMLREGVKIQNDKENDFYDVNGVPSPSKELDMLSDDNEKNDLIKIPVGVDRKSDMLLDAAKQLTPKQQAMVLNKMIEELDTDNIPYMWKKELIEKLK